MNCVDSCDRFRATSDDPRGDDTTVTAASVGWRPPQLGGPDDRHYGLTSSYTAPEPLGGVTRLRRLDHEEIPEAFHHLFGRTIHEIDPSVARTITPR